MVKIPVSMPSPNNRASISAFVVCFNEEAKISRCLDSLAWCDEVVVVDSGSTDRTREICERKGVKFCQHAWEGYVEQKRFALSQCACDWVLNIDADEQVSDDLCREIISLLQQDSLGQIEQDGFELNRVVYFLGRWWRKGGWYPEYRLRLCRRSKTAWGGDNPHEKAIVNGKIGSLSAELFHFTYDSFSDQIRSLNSHSSMAAESLHRRGARFKVSDLIFRPISRFLKFFILRRGYREGLDGLVVGLFESFYVLMKYAKLRELELRTSRKSPENGGK